MFRFMVDNRAIFWEYLINDVRKGAAAESNTRVVHGFPHGGSMIIRYNGVIKDARILDRSGDTMRIALEHSDDAVELNLVDGNWFSAERQQISFEFLWESEIPLLLPE